MQLDPGEFLRRFSMHIQPKGLMRIRHYGLLANRHRREQLARCRALLPADPTPQPSSPEPKTSGTEAERTCTRCAGVLIIIELESLPRARPRRRDTS